MPGAVSAFKPHITLWVVATITNLILNEKLRFREVKQLVQDHRARTLSCALQVFPVSNDSPCSEVKIPSPLLYTDTCLNSEFFSGHLLCIGRPVLDLKNSPYGSCRKLKSLKGKCFSLVNKSHRPGPCEHKWNCSEEILIFLCRARGMGKVGGLRNS